MPASDLALRWWRRAKRWLYIVHRWIGIVTCLLLVMWFLSGLVMMYVPFPSLTPAERMTGLAPIDWSSVRAPLELVERTGAAPGGANALYLEQGPFGPAWHFRGSDGVERTVSATTGAAQPVADAATARRIAAAFGRARVRAVETVARDQWTVAGGFDRYRPLWKVALDSPDGRILYVAPGTAQVVLDTDRRERFWNWLGSVPHWIYPTVLRQHQPLWRQVILWTSGAGIVGAVSGMWIGILRTRVRRRYKGGRVTPYRGWQWWHHVIGLAGGTLLVTWIVSGWLSVDPNRWFDRPGLPDMARAAYAAPGEPPAIDWRRLGDMSAARGVKRLRLVWVDGEAVLVLEGVGAMPVVLDARTLAPVTFASTRLVSAARRLVPGAAIGSVSRLTETDAYWYEAKGSVELPILRIVFDDPAATWVHISPRTGEILSDTDSRRRLYRWLFDGLHRWDLSGLIAHRPLWDAWMWLWSLAGTIVSVSGVVIGYRRLRPRRQVHHA